VISCQDYGCRDDMEGFRSYRSIRKLNPAFLVSTGDHAWTVVTWKQGDDLGHPPNSPISLRFRTAFATVGVVIFRSASISSDESSSRVARPSSVSMNQILGKLRPSGPDSIGDEKDSVVVYLAQE